MTNPGQIVRVRGRANSRASVYEASAWAQAYTSGLFDGNGTQQNTSANMSVLVGGSTTKPDVVLAQNPAGYKIALDLVGQQLLTLTTPASNSRISAIVAYTDDISINGSDTSTTGSPSSCGLIIVNGTSAATPSAPTDAQIRSAITADGATGSQASYGIIATIPVASNTTTITNSMIVNNSSALSKSGMVKASNIDFATFADYSTTEKATGSRWIDGNLTYRIVISLGKGPNNGSKAIASGISAVNIINLTGFASSGSVSSNTARMFPVGMSTNSNGIISSIRYSSGSIVWITSYDASGESGYAIVEYTKA